MKTWVEVYNTVKEMTILRKTEKEIIEAVYRDLFVLLGKAGEYRRKEFNAITDEREKEKYLRARFHRFIGLEMMQVVTQLQFIEDQYLLELTRKDRRLTKEERAKVKFRCSGRKVYQLACLRDITAQEQRDSLIRDFIYENSK